MRKITVRNQKAMEYVLYMIAGSYFAKVWNLKSKFQEIKLKLYYQEERRNNQYSMEDFSLELQIMTEKGVKVIHEFQEYHQD